MLTIMPFDMSMAIFICCPFKTHKIFRLGSHLLLYNRRYLWLFVSQPAPLVFISAPLSAKSHCQNLPYSLHFNGSNCIIINSKVVVGVDSVFQQSLRSENIFLDLTLFPDEACIRNFSNIPLQAESYCRPVLYLKVLLSFHLIVYCALLSNTSVNSAVIGTGIPPVRNDTNRPPVCITKLFRSAVTQESSTVFGYLLKGRLSE